MRRQGRLRSQFVCKATPQNGVRFRSSNAGTVYCIERVEWLFHLLFLCECVSFAHRRSATPHGFSLLSFTHFSSLTIYRQKGTQVKSGMPSSFVDRNAALRAGRHYFTTGISMSPYIEFFAREEPNVSIQNESIS